MRYLYSSIICKSIDFGETELYYDAIHNESDARGEIHIRRYKNKTYLVGLLENQLLTGRFEIAYYSIKSALDNKYNNHKIQEVIEIWETYMLSLKTRVLDAGMYISPGGLMRLGMLMAEASEHGYMVRLVSEGVDLVKVDTLEITPLVRIDDSGAKCTVPMSWEQDFGSRVRRQVQAEIIKASKGPEQPDLLPAGESPNIGNANRTEG